MQLYGIRRRNWWKTPEELEAAAYTSKQVGDEQMPRVRAEADGARRTAAGRGADLSALEEPALHELADPLHHHGPAHPGRRGELHPRRRAVRADVVEDRGETCQPHGGGGERLRLARAVYPSESRSLGGHFHRRP